MLAPRTFRQHASAGRRKAGHDRARPALSRTADTRRAPAPDVPPALGDPPAGLKGPAHGSAFPGPSVAGGGSVLSKWTWPDARCWPFFASGSPWDPALPPVSSGSAEARIGSLAREVAMAVADAPPAKFDRAAGARMPVAPAVGRRPGGRAVARQACHWPCLPAAARLGLPATSPDGPACAGHSRGRRQSFHRFGAGPGARPKALAPARSRQESAVSGGDFRPCVT